MYLGPLGYSIPLQVARFWHTENGHVLPCHWARAHHSLGFVEPNNPCAKAMYRAMPVEKAYLAMPLHHRIRQQPKQGQGLLEQVPTLGLRPRS